MSKNWLKILVAIAAIMIAGSAAFFSVTGLGVLFSGAAVAVMIMAGSLEFAKLVTATYLKQEWDNIKGINKWYLTSAVVILMLITSAGIFGYLSNAFQQQNLKLGQVQREIQVWQNKIDYSNQQISTLQGQQKDLSATQNTLITKGNVNSRLLRSVDNRDKQSTNINKKINSLQDSIVVYNGKINDVKNANIGIEREVGGFRFVAEAFGVELNSVVKFFIILIVVVFDPLAVALVISFNQLVLGNRKKEDEEPEITTEPDTTPDPIPASDIVAEVSRLRLSEEDLKILENALLNPPPPNEELKKAAEEYKELVKETDPYGEMMFNEDNARMDIIGQNGNEGLHYEEDVVNDTPVNREETEILLGRMVQSNQEMGLYEPQPYDVENGTEQLNEWDITLMDGLKDEPPYVSDDFTIGPDGAFEMTEEILQELNEELPTIEPTEEEELENFSTLEPETENISQEEYNIPVDEAIDNEPELTFEEGQLPDDMLNVLNDVETETFSETPTRLDIPPIEDSQIHVELPEIEESSTPNEEDEKKNS